MNTCKCMYINMVEGKPVVEVVKEHYINKEYANRVRHKGLVFIDKPVTAALYDENFTDDIVFRRLRKMLAHEMRREAEKIEKDMWTLLDSECPKELKDGSNELY